MTISGYLLLGDWQTIPYDPCTEYSPFHHPNLTRSHKDSKSATNRPFQEQPRFSLHAHIDLSTNRQINFDNGITISNEVPLFEVELKCKSVSNCQCDSKPEVACLDYINEQILTGLLIKNAHVLKCNIENMPGITVCVLAQNPLDYERSNESIAHVERIQVVSDTSYWIARNNCMNANVTGHTCHWIPSSVITKKECRDCPLICKSISQTLTFAQFCIGLTLLMFSDSFVFFPSTELVLNQVHSDYQVIHIIINRAL